MTFLRFGSFLFIALFFSLSPVFAANHVTILTEVPGTMVFDQEYSVTIELKDKDSEPFTDQIPTVAFAPSKSIENAELFDCGDPEEFDNCKPNNRGVKGVYESLFTIVDSPVTMTLSAAGVVKTLTLEANEAEPSVPDASPSVSEEKTPEIVSPTSVTVPAPTLTPKISPADVQAGPSPWVMFFLLPLTIILAVVTYFVVTIE